MGWALFYCLINIQNVLFRCRFRQDLLFWTRVICGPERVLIGSFVTHISPSRLAIFIPFQAIGASEGHLRFAQEKLWMCEGFQNLVPR